jgi:NAD(P)-dependent dehydrogenase (short-subunit alcohol dehydrogenase family)
MFTVNVKSRLHVVKAALPALRRGANGSVILTGDVVHSDGGIAVRLKLSFRYKTLILTY